MKLKRMKLKNFRCFGAEETVIDFENLTTIIGANSSGKTALMAALLKLFGENSAERELIRSDFHFAKGVDSEEVNSLSCSIEAVFEFEELEEETPGENSGNADKLIYAVPIFFENFVILDEGKPPYLRVLMEANWNSSSSPEGTVDAKYWCINTAEGTPITDENKKYFSRHDLSHIKVIYVPALRNPLTQLKNASGTILWRVLKGINWTKGVKEGIKNKISEVDNLIDKYDAVAIIKKSIQDQWGLFHHDHRYTETDVKFNSTDLESMLKRVEIEFHANKISNTCKVDQLGDGLRSLFYLSLVSSLLDIEDQASKLKPIEGQEGLFNIYPPALTILAVEEPENHIAPHLLGKVVSNFRNMSLNVNAQVVITSHSPSIVKRIDPTEIRYFRICNEEFCTIPRKICMPEKDNDAYKYVKGAVQAYPEIYFSRLVVLGEGDSEEIIIPRVLELLGHSLDANSISVVPLGGRHVNHFWRLLNDLSIPHVTLLDLDLDRAGGGYGRIKYSLQQLIKFGEDKEELLDTQNGVLSDLDLEEMHKRSIVTRGEVDNLYAWINRLEQYNVFFSSHLDIDFMMLEAYKDKYVDTLEIKEGPSIKKLGKIKDFTDADKEKPEYHDRLTKDIRATLKAEGGDGALYTDYQKELMIWYNFFFLSRGKPTTHILALSSINNEELESNLPSPLLKLKNRVKEILEKDPYTATGCGG